jgi:hypothetical protein
MGVISNDADEGLVTSLLMYVGALAAVLLLLGTPVYLLNMPSQSENHGVAVYAAPPGTRVIPQLSARNGGAPEPSLTAQITRKDARKDAQLDSRARVN